MPEKTTKMEYKETIMDSLNPLQGAPMNPEAEMIFCLQQLNAARGSMMRLLDTLGLLPEINRHVHVRFDTYSAAPFVRLTDVDEGIRKLAIRVDTDPHFAALAFVDREKIN